MSNKFFDTGLNTADRYLTRNQIVYELLKKVPDDKQRQWFTDLIDKLNLDAGSRVQLRKTYNQKICNFVYVYGQDNTALDLTKVSWLESHL